MSEASKAGTLPDIVTHKRAKGANFAKFFIIKIEKK